MFENIIGYETVKKELSLILDWYSNEKFINNENAKLPSGIIFYGSPGNGKTFFIKELMKQFKDSSYVIDGDNDNILEEITSTYKKARKNKLSLVLIDEMDLLIGKDEKIIRILQDELDGIGKGTERVLTIATTNHLYDIPDALLRSGRFDRSIFIPRPSEDEIKLLLEHYFNKLGVELKVTNYDWLIEYLGRMSCAEIMTLCNDCYFRFNGQVIDEDKLFESWSKIDRDDPLICSNDKARTKQTAYHEIGHALLVLKYNKYFNLVETRFSDNGAHCRYSRNNKISHGLESQKSEIEVTLGGVVAEKIFFNDVFLGSEDDLEKARDEINYLINRFPYKGIDSVLKKHSIYERMETEKSRYHNEKIGNKLLKECYKKAYKYLLKHKKDIIKYGDLLYEKGRLVKTDFEV